MFSFRELVESMEEKTFESVSPASPPTRSLLSDIFNDAPMDCKNIARLQTSQHRAQATDEKAEGNRKSEGFWKYSESQDLAQRKGVRREEEVVQASRTDGQYSKKMDTESLQVMKQEIREGVSLTFKKKHFSLTPKHQNFSVNDLCDAVQRNYCTSLQKTSSLYDSVYQDSALGKQGLRAAASATSFQLEHQPICSDQSSKYNLDQDLPTQASRRLNESKKGPTGKCRYLKTRKRTVRLMDTKSMARGRVCRSVKQKHFLNISDENISEREEVNVSSVEGRELRGGEDNSEDYTSHDSHFHETQSSSPYVEVCCQEMPLKETITLTKHPESHKTTAKGACDLSSFMTGNLHSTDTAAMSLLVNNMNVYYDNHKNTPCFQTRVGHEWTSHNFRDLEEVQTVRSSKCASKHGEKVPDIISLRIASRGELGCSESASHVPPSLWISDNIGKKITTQSAQSLRKKRNNFRNEKHFNERGSESLKGLQNDKVHKIERCKSSTTKGRVPTTYNENASIGDNRRSRSSSPSGFR